MVTHTAGIDAVAIRSVPLSILRTHVLIGDVVRLRPEKNELPRVDSLQQRSNLFTKIGR